MAKLFQQIVDSMILNPRKLFLVDSLGAIVSAFSLGVLLVRFENTFGMPREVLYYLALAACFFAVYSFTCYLRLPKRWRPFLQAIAIVNLIYCCITLGSVFYFYQSLTVLGITYFLLEIVVILILVSIELKTAKQKA